MTSNSRWSVRNARAASRAYSLSLNRSSRNEIENVLAGRIPLMIPTTMEESMPPERNAPTGTSATSRFRTARVIASTTRSVHSPSDRSVGSSFGSQYRSTRTDVPSNASVWPGGSLRTPS